MSVTRILFVDDEAAILNGIRDLLRKDRKRWDMVFCQGGDEALAEMKRAPAQIVVSDMRMPGMDGAQLLARIKEEYPGTTRIVLSGHADRKAVLRAVPVAHQFLAKPCDATVLRSTIERAHGLLEIMSSDAIRSMSGTLDKLPSVPRTYRELTEVASDQNKGVSDFAQVVQRDPAMSAKVLQLVNSAYFGARQPVSSIQQAVGYLGLELLKGLALTSEVFSAVDAQVNCGVDFERLQRTSLESALLARKFVEDSKRSEEAFTAALLCDVGTIVLALGVPDKLAAITRAAKERGVSTHIVEKETLGTTHGEVSAYLLGVWGLPLSIAESVAFHHRPSAVGEGSCDVLAAVHGACALAGGEELDMEFLERVGAAARLPRWRELAETAKAGMS